MSRVIVDTGPLVAYLSPADTWHEASVREFKQLASPFFTCEPVLTEASFLARRHPQGLRRLFQMLDSGLLEVAFEIYPERDPLAQLLAKYSDVPMSLADACVVRMSKQIEDAAVFTIDKHFRLYRRNGRQVIPLISPEAGTTR